MLGIQYRRASFGAAIALIAGLSGTAAWAADSIVLVGPGGLVNKAIREVYAAPFQQATGVEVVVADWGQTLGELRAQVDSSKGAWDIVMIDQYAIDAACKEELLEKFDWAKIKTDGLIDVAVQPCGVGIQGWGAIVAYNGDRVSSPPKSLQDFFDIQRWPNQNIALNMDVRGTLEFALMADGVTADKVYAELRTQSGVERAFKKLDSIKSHIKWWKASDQLIQMLIGGDAAVAFAWNGRVQGAARDNKVNLRVAWPAGGLLGWGYWGIMKGSKHQDLAYKFVTFVKEHPELQAKYPNYINYGPSLRAAYAAMPAAMQEELPTADQNRRYLLPVDSSFWTDHLDELSQRFAAWLAR